VIFSLFLFLVTLSYFMFKMRSWDTCMKGQLWPKKEKFGLYLLIGTITTNVFVLSADVFMLEFHIWNPHTHHMSLALWLMQSN